MSTADTPKYMIGVAADLLGMHPQTLRMYEARGLVRPRRTPGGTRLYSDADLDRMRRITQLATGLGVSLQGAEYVFGLEDALRVLQQRVAELEHALAESANAADRRVEQVRRAHRRELVVWRPSGSELVQRHQNT